MTIYVLTASGTFTTTMDDGEVISANRVELIQAFTDYQKALDLLKSDKPPDVKDPEGWGVRSVCIQPVELIMEKPNE